MELGTGDQGSGIGKDQSRIPSTESRKQKGGQMNLISIKKLPVMKIGTHIDSQGKPVNVTEADFNGMIANLAADLANNFKPPVVLGHPKMEDPRYGDFLGLQKEGSVLFADIGVVPELNTALGKGAYPDRSLRLQKMKDGTFRIKHLGLLGVVPPAVQGLPSYQFKEAEAEAEEYVTLDFSESYRMSIVGRIFRRIREAVIAKEGQEAADNIVSNWEIEDLEREMQEPPVSESPVTNFNKEEDMGEIEDLKQKLATEKAARLKLETAARQKDFAAFCEGLGKEGKLTPAMQPAVMDFMEILSGVETFDFAEAPEEGGKPASRKADQPVERFKTLLSGLPNIVEFSEFATKGKAAPVKESEDNVVVAEAKRRSVAQKK